MKRRVKIVGYIFVVAVFLWACKGEKEIQSAPSKDPNKRITSLTTQSHQGLNEVYWPFECLGPDHTPFEKNPGKKAIPAYSNGRGNGTGRVNFLYINPNNDQEVFACSPTGGLFVTRDGGEHWDNAGTDQLPISGVSSITMDSSDSKRWIIATGDSDDQFQFSDGIWITHDGGQSWTNINGSGEESFPVSETHSKRTYVSHVVAHPSDFNRVYVACNKGLYMTTNALDRPDKVKWKQIDDSFYFDIEILPWETSHIYAGGNRMICSKDRGETWQKLETPVYKDAERYKFLRISLEITPDDKEHIYAAVTNSEGVTKSKAGEANLQRFNLEQQKWEFIRAMRKEMGNINSTRARAFAISPKDKNIVLTANVQPIYRSENGGVDFNKIAPRQMHDDIHDIVFAPNGNVVWASHDGGVSRSTNGGLTWINKDRGIGVANVFGVSVAQDEEDRIVYGGYDTGGNVLRGQTWFHLLWGDGFQTIVHHSNPDELYVTRQNGYIHRSDDGGLTCEHQVKVPGSNMEWHSWIRMNTFDGTIYAAGDKLSRSSDKGENWETILDVQAADPDWHMAYKFFMAENDPNVMYAYIIRSSNKGLPVVLRTFNLMEDDPTKIVWEELELPVQNWISAIVPDAEDPSRYWISYNMYNQGNKIFYFNGEEHVNHSEELGYTEIRSMEIDRETNRLYLGTSYGLMTRGAQDDKWTLLNGLPGVTVRSMDVNYAKNKLVIGTFGRGVWQCNLIR